MVNTTETNAVESTSLAAKMINTFVSPTEVFDEVIAAPRQPAAWIVPSFLVALASIFLLIVSANPQQTVEAGLLGDGMGFSEKQIAAPTSHWMALSSIMIFAGALAGTFWSTTLVWGISRVFLKVQISFSKTLEIVGLAGMILVLGTVVTALLTLASGDAHARPALSLFATGLGRDTPIRAFLEIWNLFYIWSALVLAIGLSRLARVSLKEACFWVLGYWVVLRMCLFLLG